MAKVITLSDIIAADIGSVVWLEVAYEGFHRTGMEPFLVDIDNSQYPVITNSRKEYDNVCEEQLKEDILDSLNKDYIGKFRFWDGKASDELKKNTPWVEGEYYYYE